MRRKLYNILVFTVLSAVAFSGYRASATDSNLSQNKLQDRDESLFAFFDPSFPHAMTLTGVVDPVSKSEAVSEPVNATPPTISEVLGMDDPIQGFNRVMFECNDFLIMWFFRPVGRVYEYIIPLYFRQGIGRISDNIQMPRKVLSNMCRARFGHAGIEFSRFLINTTLGIGGFYDPAKAWWDIQPHNSDFGAAFASWGIGTGCYIVIPVQGSSTIRNGVGLVFDLAADPMFWVSFVIPFPIGLSINGGLRVNGSTLVIRDYERLRKSSIDLYTTMRDYWYLRRIYELE